MRNCQQTTQPANNFGREPKKPLETFFNLFLSEGQSAHNWQTDTTSATSSRTWNAYA